MSGPEWKSSTGAKVGETWLDPNIKCCDKEWISCKRGLIDEIKFKFIPKLKGTIPPQLALLTALEEIDVRNCDITGTLPDTLFSSDSIDISQTDITGTLPPTLFVSGTLKKFEAYHAGISGTIPPTIGMATQLKAARAASHASLSLSTAADNCKWIRVMGDNWVVNPARARNPNAQPKYEIRIKKNRISGSLPASMALLDAVKNNFSGTIPRGLHVSKECRLTDADELAPPPFPPGMAPKPPFPPKMAPEPPAIRRLDEREEEGRLEEGGEAGWDAPLGYAPEDEDYASYKARMQRRLQRAGSESVKNEAPPATVSIPRKTLEASTIGVHGPLDASRTKAALGGRAGGAKRHCLLLQSEGAIDQSLGTSPRNSAWPTEVHSTQVADLKMAESTDLFCDFANWRPASHFTDSSLLEVERGELERASQVDTCQPATADGRPVFESGEQKTEVAKGHHPTKLNEIMPVNVPESWTAGQLRKLVDLVETGLVCAGSLLLGRSRVASLEVSVTHVRLAATALLVGRVAANLTPPAGSGEVGSGEQGSGLWEVPPSLPPPSPPSYPLAYYTVTTTPGSYPSEVSWDLRCGGTVVLSSAPYTGSDQCGLCPDFQTEYGVSLSPGVECELHMYDSYDDGWNGASWSGLGQEGLTVTSGSEEAKSFVVASCEQGCQYGRFTHSEAECRAECQGADDAGCLYSGPVEQILHGMGLLPSPSYAMCAGCPVSYAIYGNNEMCTISGVPPVGLEVVAFDDYLTVNGMKYCSTSGPNGVVPEDGVIEWISDDSDSGGVVSAQASGAVSIIGSTVTGCSAGERATRIESEVGLQPKFKIVVGFYQVSSILGVVYGVRLDEHFTRWLDVLKLFSLDLFDVAIPGRCIGAMSTRLLVAGIWPYLAVAFVSLAIVAVAAVLNAKQKQAFDHQLLGRLLYWAIFIFYLVLPSVSRSIFSARLCESFGYDDATGRRISYLLADPSLTCDAGPTWDDETSGLAPYFWAFFALWPVLVPLGFLALLLRVRKPVAAQRATPLSRATSFLWRDYSAGFLFWEVLDLVRKIFLTSMVLFIDQEYGSRKLLRTVVAAIVSAMFLTILALARPYRRSDDLGLACVSNLLLTCCFASGVVVQLCDSTEQCYELVGFSGSLGATTFVVVLTAAMLAVSLAVILVSAISAARAKTMRLASSKREPMRDGITLAEGQQWHLFLSHVWSTGQDAVAVIKNELQQFLPGCEIFLDVDDLKNIGELEAYIRRSQVVLCFLSKGYLRSTNCLREIRAALEMGKPLVLVHEADPAKGGGTLAELRSECPEELQAAIFDAGWPMTVWHRIEAFQHVSLKVIAEALLLKTPKYAGEDALPLCIPGELRADGLAFPKPVVLWASTLNAGARELANAVVVAVSGEISVTDAPPSRLSSLPRASGSGDEATHMLLYLKWSTWAGDSAEPLAEQVRAAREARLPIVMAHENDAALGGCIFGRFFEVTPRDLIADGLYNDLAVGCHADPHRQVSIAHLAQALGATKQTATSRVRLATLARTTQTRGSSSKTELQEHSVGDDSVGDDLVEDCDEPGAHAQMSQIV
ncbi:hypothetical protein EMIHUDRAFT_451815 [Emiliania huxleyi CCMP1516]|uniref:TIR domain-containing protein n=2 Tax=Emiliania huxleyi TaxID=2903 RepID=A0A0D3IT24_EMIH1|nr:hypothetical protein EMIHUDRAFT_451815 [Emiliania huxleyi CCMP1516]EOD14409.1 hypothetical protein EMIHUDRAFT_451815 [Emiliania huxleyi CCMP1516]|eukprot:XP_005766838.1 hypothetical protein EMIHUDRAFT_451815 [Emiliania huxleyi CCMP1516]